MIVITGAKRSGTSLWMRLYKEAGYPVIGEAFPSHWASSIAAANPQGFFEAPLRHGLDARSNPDPLTGEHYTPAATRDRVAKMFIPGLLRTDAAFLDEVVLTFRDWREVWHSIERLYALEDGWRSAHGATADEPPHWVSRPPPVPWPVAWWHEHVVLLEDALSRNLPMVRLDLHSVRQRPERPLQARFGPEKSQGLRSLVAAPGSTIGRDDLPEDTRAILDHLLGLLRGPSTPAELPWKQLTAHRLQLEEWWGPYDPRQHDRD